MTTVKEKTKAGRAMRPLAALLLAAVMLAVILVPAANASAAERLTVPDQQGKDGIDGDQHNSYAWCGAVFEQNDGDYLWVGTNRDLGGLLISQGAGSASMTNAVLRTVKMPYIDADRAGKIYRYSLTDSGEQEWELMWENEAINGYRKMIIFDGHLYVFAGLSNLQVKAEYAYSVVYRFSPDFAPGDEPEVVLWSNLTKSAEFFRSACILDGKLYVGTFDGQIFCTDGSKLTSLKPNALGLGPKGFDGAEPGWEKIMQITVPEEDRTPAIWDMVAFNGSIYAFISTATIDTADGFLVYKLTDNGSGFDIEQIVGGAVNDGGDQLYPAGLGIDKHVAASPFVFTVDGKDYVYVSTFANGPAFLAAMADDVLSLLRNTFSGWSTFDNYYQPAAMYRFSEDDKWEVVVGDPRKAVDKGGNAVDRVGDMYAGFASSAPLGFNASSNLYIWWMAEYDGKIYASTWDVGSFRELFRGMLETVFNTAYTYRPELDTAIAEVVASLQGLYESAASVMDLAGPMTDIRDLLVKFMNLLRDMQEDFDMSELLPVIQEMVRDIVTIIRNVIDDIRNAAPQLTEELQYVYDSVTGLTGLLSSTSTELQNALMATLSILFASPMFAGFVLDMFNPPGFDIYCSEDGVNFYPYITDGLGDGTNYGGRVLLADERYGLFVLTANPFNGCQVWLLEDALPQETSEHHTPNAVLVVISVVAVLTGMFLLGYFVIYLTRP